MSAPEARQIVVGVDGTPTGRRAVEWAAVEAEHRTLTLRLVHAYTTPTQLYPAPGMLSTDLARAAHTWARHMLFQTSREVAEAHPALTVSTALHDGHPVAVLRRESESAALTVVGSHGSHQFLDALLGSVAARIAVHARGPVVVVRGTPTAPGRDGPVVVGVEASEDFETVLSFAFEEAAQRGTGLVAVHAWDDRQLYRAAAAIPLAFDRQDVIDEETRFLAEQLVGWSEKYPEVDVHRVVTTGTPIEQLARICAIPFGGVRASLLVVGSRGRGGFAGLMLGSTSAGLIAHAPCPVAVVRERHTPKGTR